MVNMTVLTVRNKNNNSGQHDNSNIKDVVTESSYDISGYHKTRTSVLVPRKIQLPTPAKVGSVIHVRFELVSGETFKITGMALCSF
jgi:hypothetical protein